LKGGLVKKLICAITLLAWLPALASAAPPPTAPSPPQTLDAAELETALAKLDVLGSVLYIAAHPDDENTAALAYFSKGRKYRTAYLSLTRGDGGQNLIGPEKGAEIGIIRTQELLAARRVDGAEQYFTRAIDFGYSKTAEETFEFWGKDKVLSDIVWVIRKFRPDVIITRFTAENSGGHGHHTASAILALEAFTAAADPNRFPGQLEEVGPWRAERLFWNAWRPGRQETAGLVGIDTGEYDPLLGRSYAEMAAQSRSNHKSQGFGSAPRRGRQVDYFELLAGTPARADLFEGIDTSWDRIPGGRDVGRALERILASFDPRHPAKSLPALLEIHARLGKLDDTRWVPLKKRELLEIIRSCAGLWLDTAANDYSAAPGDEIGVTTTVINRSDYPLTLRSIAFPGLDPGSSPGLPLANNEPRTVETKLRVPRDFPISQPFWLREAPGRGLFTIRDRDLIGPAENPPAVAARVGLEAGGELLEFTVPVVFRWTDRVDGELSRPFEIRPRVTVGVEDKVGIFPGPAPKRVKVRVTSQSNGVAGQVRLEGGGRWRVTPASVPFSLGGKYEEKEVVFEISPPASPGEAVLTAEADVGGEILDRELVDIAYPHITRQVYFPPSRLKVVKLDVKTAGSRIGYIMGAGDEVADGLRSLGYDVTMLDDARLENADLSGFDAIVTGIRAYNTRDRLKYDQPRLLRYVENGGTLVVQYNVSRGLLVGGIGPYPLTLGQDRVCVETAPVAFLLPDHQLLNFPNRIVPDDFAGWVQERGLYFASRWDGKYEAVLSSHDPGEPGREGGLLFARYGKGVFIYTGYAWFRQLPDGVAGAYRIMANLVSAGKFRGR
jgi:LmbE family N-acetylglucosaminyl deacetylase